MNTPTLTFDRKDELKEIAAEIDAVAEAARDYATSNEDYAEPLFYSDWEIRLDDLDEEAAELVEAFKVSHGKGWEEELKGFCDVVACGIYIQTNEISSFTVGELEEQLPDELTAKLEALTAEEFEYVRRELRECFLPERRGAFIYIGCDYDRWVLVLDVERLAEALEPAQA